MATKPTLRYTFDAVALVLHIITFCVGIFTSDFRSDTSGRWLLAMEAVTIAFHVWYVTDGRGIVGVPRASKWFEYGFSATFGTIAVLAATEWHVILLFMLIGNAQQLQGLILEQRWNIYSFISGAAIQLGEYIYVGYVAWDDREGTFLVYVAFYSLFGVLAWISTESYWEGRGDLTEEIYSLFGFVAKLAVFYAELATIVDVAQRVIMLVGGIVWVLLVGAAAALWWFRGDSTLVHTRGTRSERTLFPRIL